MRILATAALVLSTLAAPALAQGSGASRSAIARFHNGSGGYCTAVLVDDRRAVTAAHCLYSARTGRLLPASSLHLLFGYNRGDYGFHARVAGYEKGGFDPARINATATRDWAVLTLRSPVPARFSRLETGGSAAGRSFRVAGFAAPRKYVLSAWQECEVASTGSFITSECKASEGMSGAPLVDMATGALIGIQIGRVSRDGQSVLVAIPASAWSD